MFIGPSSYDLWANDFVTSRHDNSNDQSKNATLKQQIIKHSGSIPRNACVACET